MATYTNFEIDRMLGSMIILVDTREQDTPALRKRLEGFGCPFERYTLNYGDYTCEFTHIDGRQISIADRVCIERKMNTDELCGCFATGRDRFEREFLRAKNDGAKVYLLVENTNWEKIYAGAYRSRLKPEALAASILAWSIRYNMIPHYCKAETTGKHIRKILHYELKYLLERGEV